jgi:hypothetical protein
VFALLLQEVLGSGGGGHGEAGREGAGAAADGGGGGSGGESGGESGGASGGGGGIAIIYASTRKAAEAEAARLSSLPDLAGNRRRQWRVGLYHAGMRPAERQGVHEGFMRAQVRVG